MVTQTVDMAEFRGFPVRRVVWTIGQTPIELTWPVDPYSLLDQPSTRERFARNEYMPYWAQLWPASVLLAEHLLARRLESASEASSGVSEASEASQGQERERVQGQGPEAIELGCGLGLVSIAAGMAGWRITTSDYDEDALAFAALNASQNGVVLANVVQLDFVEQPPSQRYDAVFAADILYERRLAKPVARWIAAALKPGGYALLSDPNRTAADDFVTHASDCGLTVEVLLVETTAPAGLLSRGRIWGLRPS